ncbi:MAG: NOG1 family protein [Thermocladium sp.]
MSMNIPSARELLNAFMDRYKTAEARYKRRGMEAMRNLEAVRIKKSADYASTKLRGIALSMPFLKDLHPFYRELLLLEVKEEDYRHSLSKIFNASRAVKSIRRESLMMIKAAASRGDIIRARRAYLARMMDLINDLSRDIELLRTVAPRIKSMPSINASLPTIVVAGMPNTGKSSLVNCISTAKPEIADYPFTTKKIIVGHIKLFGDSMIQVLDTPGLLDRPLSERNSIELQAILAMRHLAHVIVIVMDPTPHSGNAIDNQLNLLNEVRNAFKVPLVVAINKVDIATEPEVKAIETAILEPTYRVAAAKCLGTKELRDDLIEKYVLPKLIPPQ